MTTETITEVVPSSNDVQLRWDPIANIRGHMLEYYGYIVEISETSGNTIVQNKTFSTASGKVDGLNHNTNYIVYLKTFRQHQGQREFDNNSYPLITIKTKCASE